MSSAIERRPRLTLRKYAASSPRNGGPHLRGSSPQPGRSTLMTSAPRSARTMVAYGPASTPDRASTRTPASAPRGARGPTPRRGPPGPPPPTPPPPPPPTPPPPGAPPPATTWQPYRARRVPRAPGNGGAAGAGTPQRDPGPGKPPARRVPDRGRSKPPRPAPRP